MSDVISVVRECEDCGPKYACEQHKEQYATVLDSAFQP